jgi:diguanylate cyclase (GGDEF)-like protein
MRSPFLILRNGLLAGCLLAASTLPAAEAAPSAAERGFPLIQPYLPSDPGVSPQNFGLARDPRGILYIANLSGVLIYDGAWWRTIPIGQARAAFSVASDAAGRVAVGGVDDLGILAPDARGTLRFTSLLGLLPPAQRKLGQVMIVQPTAEGFAFLTARSLLLWDGRKVSAVAAFPAGRPYATLFQVGADNLVWTREGLMRLAGRRLEPVPGGEVFRGRRVDTIVPADGGLLVSVRGEGLFLFRDGAAVPFAPAASRWSAANRLIAGAACRLPDGRWALGSILDGLLLLRPDGEVDQVIDTAVGLGDDFVNGVVIDREGALWLALNNGLARVEVASPLTVLDRRTGLQGSVYTVARHQGYLWAGTASGLFTTRGAKVGDTDAALPTVRLLPVAGVPPAVWSLASVGDDLLVGTAFGLFRVGLDGVQPVPGTDQETVYLLRRSAADPERVWMGTESGLAAVRRDGSGWRFEGRVAGAEGEVRSLVEGADGVLWLGNHVGAAKRVEVETVSAALRARRVRAIPDSFGASLFRIGGRILAAHGSRVLRLDEARASLTEEPDLAPLGGHGTIQFLAEDAAGNLWIDTQPLRVALRRGGRWAEMRSLFEVPARTIETILTEPDGGVWLAAESGLFRYAGGLGSTQAMLPAPLFARVTLGGGKLLFGGAPGTAPREMELPANLRRLRIELAPLSFRAGLRYQTRLDPIDADWGPSTPDSFTEQTRLPPGDYTFRARTLGPNGEAGPEAAWTFRVLPPWYESGWALALWTLAALLLILGYSWLRSRALRQRAARLEAQVAQQTLELRRTVTELSRAHSELEVANERLEALSLQDDLTGIANRRRLQQVLESEWKRARRYQRPLGFVLLDLDHFKMLNDTRGHREGDLCLQAVARYLAATVRRTGDLVARYGGEELAVLLPDTDLDGALGVAEQLRQGIEGLAFPHEAAPAGHVTASFGVAAMIPSPDESPEALIEAADLALYRAKTEGRNRVRAAA